MELYSPFTDPLFSFKRSSSARMKIETARDLLTASAVFEKKKKTSAYRLGAVEKNIIWEHKNLTCGEWWINVRNRAGENISIRNVCIKLLGVIGA